MNEEKRMVAMKYVAVVGMVVVAVVAFVVGLYASPMVFPPAEEVEDPFWDRITESGTIIVGTEPGWPPYEFEDEQGNIIGFEVDIMNMIADDLDLEVDWRDMGFDAIILAVQAGDIDLGVSGFSVTAERLEVVDFTLPHSITEGQIVMLQSKATEKGVTMLKSLTNLTDYGITCGVQGGTTQSDELGDLAQAQRQVYEDFQLALQAMKTGVVDSVYAETPITSNWILEAEQAGEPAIVVVYKRPYYPVAFIANKDADTLVAKIDGALAEIIASGRLDELRQEWKT
jgi:ABC-type amino acid transport substrate-binding protein